MRVRYLLLLAAAILLSFSACGGGGSAPPTTATSTAKVDPTLPPPDATVIGNLQNRPGWNSCSATIGNNFTCASGLGQAVAWMAQNQTTPSMSGASAQFHLGGPIGYSNNLWWNELSPNSSATHFKYDFWILTPDPKLPQALEFDVNQSLGGTRWVFGTECNLDGNGRWDVWDASPPNGHWVPTSLGCPQLAPNTWAHFVWYFERAGDKVHYMKLTVNGTDYTVDMYQAAEANWPKEQLNVAVQLDGNATQQSYSVFVDQLEVTYW